MGAVKWCGCSGGGGGEGGGGVVVRWASDVVVQGWAR